MEAYDREVGWLGWWSREESNGILAESFEAAIMESGCWGSKTWDSVGWKIWGELGCVTWGERDWTGKGEVTTSSSRSKFESTSSVKCWSWKCEAQRLESITKVLRVGVESRMVRVGKVDEVEYIVSKERKETHSHGKLHL